MAKSLLVLKSPSAAISDLNGYQKVSIFECNSAQVPSDIFSLADSSFDEGRVLGFYPQDELQSQIFRILKAKGKLGVHGCIPDRESGQTLATDLKIQGFNDIMVAKVLIYYIYTSHIKEISKTCHIRILGLKKDLHLHKNQTGMWVRPLQ